MRRALRMAMLLAVLLSSCAPAVPTIDVAAVQTSAVEAASTMIALTQAAVPTATPIPPTPLPSATLPPAPTFNVGTFPGALPTTASTTAADPCNAPMILNPLSPKINVEIKNDTKAHVVLSVWMNPKNDYEECGYLSFNLGSRASTTTKMPLGCYGAAAFITDAQNPSRAYSTHAYCFSPDVPGEIVVGTEVIEIAQ